ncbi:MAG: YggS family pyridoxal phosphate-dependent enzyme, partial [Desulfotomaculales bacterium]
MGVQENIRRLREKIAQAAVRAGRKPDEVRLVAVTKGVSPERVKEALAAGVRACGENRVQEMLAKQPLLPAGTEWHFIGHLQTNKVKYIIGRINLLHSLDSWRLAREIDRLAGRRGKEMKVLVQVNVSGEKTKSGLAPEEVLDFLEALYELPALRARGLMTIAPAVRDPEEARPVFRHLRLLLERARARFPGTRLDCLSMGMSGDYPVAVEEGASILWIGT